MKFSRNQSCPCGSGLKFKKCCLKKKHLNTTSAALDDPNLAVSAIIVDDVLDDIFSSHHDVLFQRIEALANSQPDLTEFIIGSPLPDSISFPAALSAFAIIWMFDQHHRPRELPKIGVASIQSCFERSARAFFDFKNPHATMSGSNQPHIHKFIADTIFDFDEGELDDFDLCTVFMTLKTTVDVLHDATSNIEAADSMLSGIRSHQYHQTRGPFQV